MSNETVEMCDIQKKTKKAVEDHNKIGKVSAKVLCSRREKKCRFLVDTLLKKERKN